MWADGVPNLLIGLREGLEGGLVVSILLAAVRRAEQSGERRVSTAPVWLGVLVAVLLSLSFGAVLTFSRAALSTTAQEAFGGTLSVVAVGLVTAMVFWMRRAARGLSGELKAKVGAAIGVGAGALALTAFLAVGREGLETALFLWTAVQASGESTAPLVGAGVGVLAAAVLCWLIYRSAVRINLGVFFSRTAVALIVIAAGVLAYGLGELQGAGLLPGHSWVAFDLGAVVSADAWWVTLVRGVTNLAPAMTWLQVVAYLVYLGVVLALFFRRPAASPAKSEVQPEGEPEAVVEGGRRRPRWVVVTAAVLVPLAAAGAFWAMSGSGAAGESRSVTITADACAPDFTALDAGQQTFTVVNKSGKSGEIYLIRPSDGGVLGEIEGIGPGTARTLPVALPSGDYAWRCEMSGDPERRSATVHAAGGSAQAAPPAVLPLAAKDLDGPLHAYQDYVSGQLATLAGQVDALRAAVAGGDLAAARTAWLPAQLTWDRVGASYGSFGDLGTAIDGEPHGLPDGVADKDFGGLRRLEHGLWHGQDAATLTPVADKLVADVAALREKLPTITADPRDLPLRAHEILEDSLRDRLTGQSDQGAGSGYPETLADLAGTRVVLDQLAPLITARRPDLLPAVTPKLDALEAALKATQHGDAWDTPLTAPLAERQRVQAAIGDAVEALSPIPDLLEIRQN